MRIYLTYCSAKKDSSINNTGQKVPPEALYCGPNAAVHGEM